MRRKRRRRRSRRKGKGKESGGENAEKERVQFAFYTSRSAWGACSILSDDVCTTIDNLVGELA